MSRPKPAISLAAPVIASTKAIPQPTPSRAAHKKRIEAQKTALLALEQSLRLQAYTVRLPRTHALFSGNDSPRPVFPSAPLHIARIHNGK